MKWVAEIEIFLPVWVPGLNQYNWIESVWSQWGRELEADTEFPLSIPISAGKDLQVHLAHLLVTLLNTTRVWDFNLTYFICNVHQCSLLNKLNICSSVKYSLHWWHFAHRVWCAKKIIFSENVEFDTWLGMRDPSCKVLQGLLYQTVKLRKLHEIFQFLKTAHYNLHFWMKIRMCCENWADVTQRGSCVCKKAAWMSSASCFQAFW